MRRRAFTLVEILVVIGIIALLIAILLPAISRARAQSNRVACLSNLRQVGQLLLMYANANRGWLQPVGPGDTPLGGLSPEEDRWPMLVFKPAVWNPPLLRCPADYEPEYEHSYVLNFHLVNKGIKYGSSIGFGLTPSDVVLMGEKKTDHIDYYIQDNTYDDVFEPFRHGAVNGSNYLYVDMHAGSTPPKLLEGANDPWDLPGK